jgi:predicted RNA-binding Zn-ribbon protein involved in translation (DUF1610 family)
VNTGVYNEVDVLPVNSNHFYLISDDPGVEIHDQFFDQQTGRKSKYTGRYYHTRINTYQKNDKITSWKRHASFPHPDDEHPYYPSDFLTLQQIETICSRHSLNTYNLESFENNWFIRSKFEPCFWDHYGTTRFSNLDFQTYVKKQKYFTDLVRDIKHRARNDYKIPLTRNQRRLKAKMKQGEVAAQPLIRRVIRKDEDSKNKKIVLAIGAAKLTRAYRGHVKGPSAAKLKKLGEFFPVVLVDEYRSTKLCSTCGLVLEPHRSHEGSRVRREANPNCRDTIYRCNTCQRYRNRDINASRSIGSFLGWSMNQQGTVSISNGSGAVSQCYRIGNFSRSIHADVLSESQIRNYPSGQNRLPKGCYRA